MPYLFLALVVTPIVELWIILKVGAAIGAGYTVLLILLTAIIGAMLLRYQGFSTLFKARQKMEEGKIPAKEMVEGLMLAFAGALMLTPGFVTDTIGFLLLMPPVRSLLIEHFQSNIVFAASGGQYRSYQSNAEDEVIIEGEFYSESEQEDQKLL